MTSVAYRQNGSPGHGQAIRQKTPAAQREIQKTEGCPPEKLSLVQWKI